MENFNITPELAEIAGIHAGDGYLRYYGKHKEIDISGGLDEKGYYDFHVIPLFNGTFGLSIKGKMFESRGTYGFRSYDKLPINTLAKLGFPSGNKSTVVKVPDCILNNEDDAIMMRFLRGYFDTDGYFTFDRKSKNSDIFKKNYNYYPRIMFTTCSEQLKDGLEDFFSRMGFIFRAYVYKPKKETESLKYKLQITGNKALSHWMATIGSMNPSKYSRYFVWKKFGFCPPRTTYQQRLEILKGELDPYKMGL